MARSRHVLRALEVRCLLLTPKTFSGFSSRVIDNDKDVTKERNLNTFKMCCKRKKSGVRFLDRKARNRLYACHCIAGNEQTISRTAGSLPSRPPLVPTELHVNETVSLTSQNGPCWFVFLLSFFFLATAFLFIFDLESFPSDPLKKICNKRAFLQYTYSWSKFQLRVLPSGWGMLSRYWIAISG